MKTILFYWSKGAETRRNIVQYIHQCEAQRKPCYMNSLAKKLNLSHVAIKKHLEILIEEGYVEVLNPKSKPKFLVLTEKGKEIAKELKKNV